MISRTSFVVILKGFVKKSLRARIICFNMLASRARFSTRTQTVKYENSDSKKSAFFGKFGKKNHFFTPRTLKKYGFFTKLRSALGPQLPQSDPTFVGIWQAISGLCGFYVFSLDRAQFNVLLGTA